jgi:hypothetical protein
MNRSNEVPRGQMNAISGEEAPRGQLLQRSVSMNSDSSSESSRQFVIHLLINLGLSIFRYLSR